MKIFLILKELIIFFFFIIFHKIKNYYKRILFLLEKKKINIGFSDIFSLSSITILNLQKVNKGNYETKVFNYLLKKSKNMNFFFDIGAHYGFYSKSLSKNFKKVYAFEANPENFKLLKNNLKNINNVKLYNSFIGKKKEKINFLISYNSYLSQIDKKSFLSFELDEFCKDGFYYRTTIEYLKIYKICYSNLSRKKFFFNFLYLICNLLANRKLMNINQIKKKLKLFRRFNFFYERYICKKIVIKSYPLDELLKGYFKRALVKIDVEGAEEEVISGMKKFLKKNKPDIFCEIGHNHKKIINFIVKLGYKYIKIDWKSFYFTPKNYENRQT